MLAKNMEKTNEIRTMALKDVLNMFPNLVQNGLVKFKMIGSKSKELYVSCADVATLITDYERRVLESTYVSHITAMVPAYSN